MKHTQGIASFLSTAMIAGLIAFTLPLAASAAPGSQVRGFMGNYAAGPRFQGGQGLSGQTAANWQARRQEYEQGRPNRMRDRRERMLAQFGGGGGQFLRGNGGGNGDQWRQERREQRHEQWMQQGGQNGQQGNNQDWQARRQAMEQRRQQWMQQHPQGAGNQQGGQGFQPVNWQGGGNGNWQANGNGANWQGRRQEFQQRRQQWMQQQGNGGGQQGGSGFGPPPPSTDPNSGDQ
jgi:hypothetical protein